MSGFDVPGANDFHPAEFIRGDSAQPIGDGERVGAPQQGENSPFASALTDALLEVDRLGDQSAEKAAALARGEPVQLHDLMIAMGKSDVAFNLMLEVRNKMVEAWQQLARSAV